jgi:hypothetical protein
VQQPVAPIKFTSAASQLATDCLNMNVYLLLGCRVKQAEGRDLLAECFPITVAKYKRPRHGLGPGVGILKRSPGFAAQSELCLTITPTLPASSCIVFLKTRQRLMLSQVKVAKPIGDCVPDRKFAVRL